MEASWVPSMMDWMLAFARVMKTLLGRLQSESMVGRNRGSSVSKSVPSSEAATLIRSTAEEESRERSDDAALEMARWFERRIAKRAVGYSAAVPFVRATRRSIN